MSNKDLGNIRREYNLNNLDESHLPENPMILFAAWLDQARASANPDPTAMTLSTVDPNGYPSSRIVLLKKIDDGKLVFFTNYHSRKASEINAMARVATHFYWPELERQVKIAGTARPIDDANSDLYFQSRPLESNICAWASPQSKEIPNRQYLEEEYEKYLKKFGASEEIPRPSFWGGYAITPWRIEFWQGGNRRLHDRIVYSRKDELWRRVRLAP